LVTSQVDRQAFQALLPAGASQPCIDVVPNGVDLQRFTPGPFEDRAAQTLVVSGKMSYHANVAMVLYLVDEVMPRVWAHMPEARLDLIGKDPPQEIQALGADPRIRVTGYVADMRPYLAGAAAAAAPLTYGAGIQNKVLEAMACGTPVVTTPLAVTALAAVPGKEILVGANAELFAQEVLHLLQDRSFRRQVGEAGRAYVETHHDWQRVATLLEHIYSEAIAQKRG
jgi:glycosyltransferase involved in cell wall biosynthesis